MIGTVSSTSDKAGVSRPTKNGKHTPIEEFVGLKSLLYSSKENKKGGDGAGDHYKQAALLIEFLRESKFGKAKFDEFLDAMGRVPRGNVERIDAVFRDVYGSGLSEVDAAFQAYCKKR